MVNAKYHWIKFVLNFYIDNAIKIIDLMKIHRAQFINECMNIIESN